MVTPPEIPIASPGGKMPPSTASANNPVRCQATSGCGPRRDAPHHCFLLLGQINDPKAAFANFLRELVAADFVSGLFHYRNHRCGNDQGLGRDYGRWFFEELPGLIVRSEQRFHLLPKRWVAGAFPIQHCGAFGGVRQFQRRGEKFVSRLGHETVDALGDKLD